MSVVARSTTSVLRQLAVDREARDELHRGGANLRRRIALRERDEQIELAVAREHDREVPSHAGIRLVARAELGDRIGRAQRERPDRPDALLGTTAIEKLLKLALRERTHVLEALELTPRSHRHSVALARLVGRRTNVARAAGGVTSCPGARDPDVRGGGRVLDRHAAAPVEKPPEGPGSGSAIVEEPPGDEISLVTSFVVVEACPDAKKLDSKLATREIDELVGPCKISPRRSGAFRGDADAGWTRRARIARRAIRPRASSRRASSRARVSSSTSSS